MDDKPVQSSTAASPFRGMEISRTGKRPRWRSALLIVAVVLVAVAVAFGLSKCVGQGGPGGPGGPGGRFGRAPTTVGVAKAVAGELPIQQDALGTVTSRATVTVTSRIAGNLTRVAFREGQMVRKGELIAEVDERPYTIALKQAQGQLLRDQAALDNAKLLLSRDQTLLAQDSIARQDVDTQAATVKADEGVVRTDEAAVDNARLNLVYCRVTAPVAGRIGLRQVDVGNYVTAGSSTGLAVITEIDPIDVVFTLPEDQVPQVSARMRTGAVLPVTALDRTGGQILAKGVLSTLDNQVDVTTGTVKAKAAFSNSNGVLFPNQFVNVRVLVDTRRNAVIVPAAPVRHGPQGDFVWLLQPDRTAKMQAVKLGPSLAEQASILYGVQVGQTVITEGGDRLRDGAPVLLPGQRPGGFGGKGGRGGRRGGPGGGFGGQGGGFPPQAADQGSPTVPAGPPGAGPADQTPAAPAAGAPGPGGPGAQFWRRRHGAGADGAPPSDFGGGQGPPAGQGGFGPPGAGPPGAGQFWRHRRDGQGGPGGPGGPPSGGQPADGGGGG